MNKAQLIELIQSKLGADTTKKHAEEALAAVLESIKEGVKESGKVQIIGFGTFATKTREARTGRNPKTGKAINIPASKTVAFKASSALNPAKSRARLTIMASGLPIKRGFCPDATSRAAQIEPLPGRSSLPTGRFWSELVPIKTAPR